MLALRDVIGVRDDLVEDRHARGRRRSEEDFDAAMYYWSYIACIFGVAEELIPRNAVDALEAADFMTATAGGPSEWTAVMADHATTGFADQTITGAIKRALAAPVLGLMACYVNEPLVRALFKTTPLHAVRLGMWPQVFNAALSLNVHYCAALDRLPAAGWRQRQKARNGDPFWRLMTNIAKMQAARRGITGTPTTTTTQPQHGTRLPADPAHRPSKMHSAFFVRCSVLRWRTVASRATLATVCDCPNVSIPTGVT